MRTVAHLSDLHFGRHDETVAECLLESIREARPDVIVVTGDLTQRGRRYQFAAARAFLDKLPQPVVVLPGNHDVPLYDIGERFLGRLARYQRYICEELQPFFTDDEIALLGINTVRSATFANGRISYEQAEAVRAIFSNVPTGRFKILATHHPLLAPPAMEDFAVVGRAKMALRAIREAGVHLLLAGHHHRAFSGDLMDTDLAAGGSILVVQAGTAISTRLRAEPNSYNILHIDGTRVTCVVQALQHQRFAAAGTAEFALLGDQWVRQ